MRHLAKALFIAAMISAAASAGVHRLGVSGWWSVFIGLLIMAAFNFITQGVQAGYSESDTVRMDGVSRIAFRSNLLAVVVMFLSMIGSWLVLGLGNKFPYSAAQYAVFSGSAVMAVHLMGYGLIALVMVGRYSPPRMTD